MNPSDKTIRDQRVESLKSKMRSIKAKDSGNHILNITYRTCGWDSYTLEFLIEYDYRVSYGNDKYGIYYGVRALPTQSQTPCSDCDIAALNSEWKEFIEYLEHETQWPIQMSDNAGTANGYWIFWVVLGDWQDVDVAVNGVERIFDMAREYFIGKKAFTQIKDVKGWPGTE